MDMDRLIKKIAEVSGETKETRIHPITAGISGGIRGGLKGAAIGGSAGVTTGLTAAALLALGTRLKGDKWDAFQLKNLAAISGGAGAIAGLAGGTAIGIPVGATRGVVNNNKLTKKAEIMESIYLEKAAAIKLTIDHLEDLMTPYTEAAPGQWNASDEFDVRLTDEEEVKARDLLQDRVDNSFSLRHPWITGIPTLGIAPGIARVRAYDAVGSKMRRDTPELRERIMDANKRANAYNREVYNEGKEERIADADRKLKYQGMALAAGVANKALERRDEDREKQASDLMDKEAGLKALGKATSNSLKEGSFGRGAFMGHVTGSLVTPVMASGGNLKGAAVVAAANPLVGGIVETAVSAAERLRRAKNIARIRAARNAK
jgi:hypothetical protein